MYLEAWSRPGGLTGRLELVSRSARGPAVGATRRRAASSTPTALPVIEVPTLAIWGEQDRALTTGNLDGLDQHVRQPDHPARARRHRTGSCTSSRS